MNPLLPLAKTDILRDLDTLKDEREEKSHNTRQIAEKEILDIWEREVQEN